MSAADTATRLIKQYGRLDGVLRRPSNANTVTVGKPWAPTALDPVTDPILASGLPVVILDASMIPKSMTLIPTATAMAYMPAGLVVPNLGDVLETKGERYFVEQAEELSPGSINFMYILHLRS